MDRIPSSKAHLSYACKPSRSIPAIGLNASSLALVCETNEAAKGHARQHTVQAKGADVELVLAARTRNDVLHRPSSRIRNCM